MRYNRKIADAFLNFCENNDDVWIYRRNAPTFEVTFQGHRVHWTVRCQIEGNTLHLESHFPVHIPPAQMPMIQKCLNGINEDFSLGQFEMKTNRNALGGEVTYKTEVCMTKARNILSVIAEQFFIHRLTVEDYHQELMRITFDTAVRPQETSADDLQQPIPSHPDSDATWATRMVVPMVGQMPNFGWYPAQAESPLPMSKP